MAALAAVAAIAAFREQKNEILRLQERERHDDKGVTPKMPPKKTYVD